MRPSVVVINLEVLREALIHFNRQRIVVRADAAEDFRHGTERRVRTGTFEQGGRIGWPCNWTACSNPVGHRAGDGGIDVGVYEVRQITPEAAEVANGNGGLPGK